MNFEQLQEHVRSQLVALSSHWDADPSAALTRQLEHVKSRTYDVEFPLLKARQFIPVATDADPAAESILNFRVDGVHAAHAALLARGVDFLDAPHVIHRHDNGSEEWMKFFKDLEGRPLALMCVVRAAGDAITGGAAIRFKPRAATHA